MTSDSAWKLFAETGDITYYLLYKQLSHGQYKAGENRCEYDFGYAKKNSVS